jgi:protease-4
MQRHIDDVYDRFLKLGSQSRDIPISTLQGLAGGRVWSGEQAKQHRLVDEIGGLDDCIAVVAKKAGVEKYKLVYRPDVPSGFDLFRMLEEREDEMEIQSSGGSSFATMSQLQLQLMQLLNRRGFRGDATRALMQSAFGKSEGMPKAWLLLPDEMRLR